jgi:hypothetical protein
MNWLLTFNLLSISEMHSVSIPIKIVISNSAHGKVHSIQHYVIKFAAGRRFSPHTLVSFTNKTDCYDITEILLKVALYTITLTISSFCNGNRKMFGLCTLKYHSIHTLRLGMVIIPPLVERGLYCKHLVRLSVRSHFCNRYLSFY